MLEIILSICFSLISNTVFPYTDTSLPKDSETIHPTPVQIENTRPNLQSKASLIYDINSNSILYSENPDQKLPIASLTKLMTAYIITQENSIQEVVTVPFEATTIGGSTMNLYAGERITIENLLKGLMINSGNDAAITLAIHNSGDVEKFVEKMNTYAQNLKLNNTHYQNPMGYDSEQNYSTVSDLLVITQHLIKTPYIKTISNIKQETVYSIDNRFSHNLKNTNQELHNFQNINGLKTGTTNIAGQCLITTTQDPNPKISIFLGSTNRFLDTKTMLDWTQNNFNYK